MKKRNQSILLALLVVLLTFQLNAQEKVIHGTITTFDSIPLIEANIWVRSTKQTVLSDSLGNFSVGCNTEDKLKVSANGFYTQNVKLTSKIKYAAINLKLKPGAKSRKHAIGYGHVSDAEKLNAVSSLNNEDIDFSQYSSMFEVIRGRFAGVQVVNGEIIIRGVNSINSSSAALIVIDGIPSDESVLNTIPPIQVKSVNVIKDGSAAIYGSRGANGVIIIETKRSNDD
ncbi:MAG: TonB-dependent receptor plug domain-containing protein [Prolixibacteraceae bacterium]|jgi:TonB-dependent SusC/RagA subfamily outer membrane receptor|nr:TonB-dependent receptor plug domain-containing protein [Prolixibacteraceae bacterium]MBT6006872.1 TonB-dependent receptor plug domain-containing protein [Prolixibacteraceae bacterium]MBT6766140.1 TonB-dependent receptor plug domain-containing protein [Prolixibacteraceae bacterium]MBT6996934.1 TonB-dependent receptor plug domain-containing protein [Prolixibacteraceae bacterium]MBT7395382.1 TonB-dependent receptor plug domain-containing protein [Prolixibacteraceae bacterium]